MIAFSLPPIAWVIIAGAICLGFMAYAIFEPYFDKTANGWVFWYTNLKGHCKHIKL